MLIKTVAICLYEYQMLYQNVKTSHHLTMRGTLFAIKTNKLCDLVFAIVVLDYQHKQAFIPD